MGKENAMYEVNTYVRYGGNGVFRIKEIITKKLSMRERKQYYVLERVFGVETQITTPVDNPNLRAIISKADVEKLIEEMPTLETNWIDDRRMRSEAFKAMLASNDVTQLASLIKTIHLRQEEKEKEKKQISDEDLATYTQAEEILAEEIALIVGIEKHEVTPYILSKVAL